MHLTSSHARPLVLLTLLLPGQTPAQPADNEPLPEAGADILRLPLFEPVTDRLITDNEFRLARVPGAAQGEAALASMRLQRSCQEDEAPGTRALELVDRRLRTIDDRTYLIAATPRREDLVRALQGPADRVCLRLHYTVDGARHTDRFPLQVPSKVLAYVVAFGFLALFLLLMRTAKSDPFKPDEAFANDICRDRWQEQNQWAKRFLKFPLTFAITPMGSYSISLTQALLWTYLTVFMSVYIYWLYGSLLDLTPQILAMLGIGGATAVAAKINAVSKSYQLPEKYLKLIDRRRVPQLRDLISTNDRPNLFKFQILAFTLIAGGFVLLETLQTFRIPEIPDSLVALMGLSTVVYLGNEVSAQSVWDQIRTRVQGIEQFARDHNAPIATTTDLEALQGEGAQMVDALKTALKSVYG